ncbi:MAG: DEAD/DEAH box helicase [Rhodococcus sp.]|nr:DEAD/DEAH box helicase [Rhodococcus sp. (in: high G+C Gram-positive bacteria)]
MRAEPVHSLELRFSDTGTRAQLRAGTNSETALRKISLRFLTAVQKSPSILEVEIDDLLTNLDALASWPEPASVYWNPQLANLASDSVADSQAVKSLLDKEKPAGAEIDLDTVLDSEWVGDLTPFQRRDIRKILALRHGANFSVPGAGKTRVGLAVFQTLRNTQGIERLLIVGPKSCYEAWQEENSLCLRDPLDMQVLAQGIRPSTDVLIINYERLGSTINELSDWLTARPSMIILDEAHRMKLGADGVYGSACLALGPRARHRLILTGTPAPNGSKDLENLFGFVWPGHGRRKVTQAVGTGDLAHASQVLRPLFTRTTKHELNLPPVTPVIRSVALPGLHREIYDALVGHLSARAAGHESDFEALGRVLIYLMMAATTPALLAVGSSRHEPIEARVPSLQVPENSTLFELMHDLPAYEMSPKYREVLAIVAANAAAGRKTLVWSTFIRSITSLNQILSAYSPAVVHGGSKDRGSEIERFRNDPDCLVLISNPATLGEGISLHHHCHDAVYVDRDFAAGRFLQSLDRIHRLGMAPDTETRITILVAEKTIDEIIEARLADKLQFMGSILDDPAVRQLADLELEPSVGSEMSGADLLAVMGHLRGDTP